MNAMTGSSLGDLRRCAASAELPIKYEAPTVIALAAEY